MEKVKKSNNHKENYNLQTVLFNAIKPTSDLTVNRINSYPITKHRIEQGYFQIQNRRYLGNKYKLLEFIQEIINLKCDKIDSFCDIFGGTGVVGDKFNSKEVKIISNDLLNTNYVCLKTFLEPQQPYLFPDQQLLELQSLLSHLQP